MTVAPETTGGARPASREKRRRPGRTGAVVAVAVVLLAGGVIVVTDPFAAGPVASSSQSAAATGLAKVTTTTLSARSVENGTLGFAGGCQVVNNAGGRVTALPAVGDVVAQGGTLYKVDGKPVVLLQGGVPLYRALSWGMSGPDVQQLNAALVALGYASGLDSASDFFSGRTYRALTKLQKAVGLTETGQLALDQAVFVPVGEARVTKVNAVTGSAAPNGGTLLEVSSTQRVVTLAVNARRQSSIEVGDRVTISLPDGKTTPGAVTSVGKVATEQGDEGSGDATVEVLVTPSEPAATGRLDKAPVQVSIVSETVADVLAVPVNALLAVAGGGYAVEVVEKDGQHRVVPVTTGLFDDDEGEVEVSGRGLAAGQDVVVPAS
ncbi:Putative peptidoglycan binding domain-containing protein [Amycolatopsis pretoriensis]|uniref:Putative peptidoglycan binding domain-containing protein n=1 Tax=Amycolatopsis pretoriensis TaxID=218821 RepID=A0A1H5R1N3_9PSEU|nr:peptidoglycan-binding protein [Amycolatopsis pretoriensis]SEF32293.1 Putative peptidoglycan binding domain-containing protein [Amycolatopsis pretoriensis]